MNNNGKIYEFVGAANALTAARIIRSKDFTDKKVLQWISDDWRYVMTVIADGAPEIFELEILRKRRDQVSDLYDQVAVVHLWSIASLEILQETLVKAEKSETIRGTNIQIIIQ